MSKAKTSSLSVNEEDLVKQIEERIEQSRQTGLERQWQLNIAYYSGKQWISWDKARKILFEPPKEWYEERLVANRIMPAVRQELAKITRSKPVIQAIPARNEEAAISAAKGASRVLEQIWRVQNMREKVFDLGLWMLTCGTSFLKAYWNPRIGEVIGFDEKNREIRLGDVQTDVVSSFDLLVDRSAQTWDQVRWVIERKRRTTDYVMDTYGVKVDPEDNLLNTSIFDNILSELNGFNNDVSTKSIDAVSVKELWELPSKKYPNGRHVTIANGKLLQYEDNPYKRIPYFPFIHIRVPGRVWGASIIEHLIPIQKEFNKTRSQRVEMRNKTANPRMLAPVGSLETEPTNAYGEIVEYNPGLGKPEWEQPPGEPSYIQREIELMIQDFNDISSQHEVSNGQTPPGVKSGIAINFLQEQDDTRLGPTIHSLENGLEQWAKFILELVKTYYEEPRLIQVIGKDSEIDTFEFRGSDLEGTVSDVIVVAGSALPQSKAARQEFVLNLVDRGILTDPQVILKLLEFGNIEEVWEEEVLDINQAKAENKRLSQGDTTVRTRDFYNHDIHIKQHNIFRKTADYEQLDPQLQQFIDMHVQEHEQFIQQAAFNQALGGLDPVSQAAFQSAPPQAQQAVMSQFTQGGGSMNG